MARLLSAQAPFTILVANIDGAGDPSHGRNPVKIRTAIQTQTFGEVSSQTYDESKVGDPQAPGLTPRTGLLDYTTAPVPVASHVTITVADNDFSFAAVLYLGSYSITSGVDYAVGVDTDTTAAALAAAINALPAFTATALLSVVSVVGPTTTNANNMQFVALYRGTIANYTLSPTTGYFSGGEPTVGPYQII